MTAGLAKSGFIGVATLLHAAQGGFKLAEFAAVPLPELACVKSHLQATARDTREVVDNAVAALDQAMSRLENAFAEAKEQAAQTAKDYLAQLRAGRG